MKPRSCKLQHTPPPPPAANQPSAMDPFAATHKLSPPFSQPGRSADVEDLRRRVEDAKCLADELEKKVRGVSQFYSGKQCKGIFPVVKEKERLVGGVTKKNVEMLVKKEGSCSRRMQELMRQFGTILRQISQDKWAWPFMEPVDVEGLGLHDYHEIIKKPMDFSTIRNKMENKDSMGYKHVREIYADVRLVFTNAMTYNDEEHDIHCMAKKLMEKFEEKWHQLLPKVIEEEARQKEEAKTHLDTQSSKEATFSKIVRDTNIELVELNMHLDELRAMVVNKCRKISTEEKRRILLSFSELPLEQINKALDMINDQAQDCQISEFLVDMDALSELTLWRLKCHISSQLKVQTKNSATKTHDNTKRKREICDALVKNAKKRIKKS